MSYYFVNSDKKNHKMITIPLEEYKELLLIKGKYEELKENDARLTWYPYIPNIPTITWGDYPYSITCDYESYETKED